MFSGKRYADLIGCKNAQEVLAKVQDMSSDLSQKDRIVRSVILEIHGNIERLLKSILYEHLVDLMFRTKGEEEEDEARRQKLGKAVTRLNFSVLHGLLRPCFHPGVHQHLEDIGKINELRNHIAHPKANPPRYKERNPFCDFDCLAQLAFDGFAIREELSQFYERMIDDRRWERDHPGPSGPGKIA